MIWSSLLHVLLGWVGWSLTHYSLHRVYHWAVTSNSRGSGFVKWVIDGEELHHVIYDDRPPDIAQDPRSRSVTFPIALAYTLFIPAIGIYYWQLGLRPALCLAFGMIVTAHIDDQTHKRSHPRRDSSAYRTGNFFQRLHDTHHDSFWHLRQTGTGKVHNYGFCTGIIWDMVFGTWQSPEAERRLGVLQRRSSPGGSSPAAGAGDIDSTLQSRGGQ
jgi:hypothetical protein